MSGAFAEWQPRYAERSIATFPVKDKKPCVRGWQSVGLDGSSQLALKFPEVDAFGFQCGKHSGITILDIDSPEERLVEEAVKIFGTSPVLWRTGSGNHAMPFRFNGEKRRIKPIAELPIDILGSGGYAIAPPSIGRKGRYEFLLGGLVDLCRLPTLCLPANENGPTSDKIPIGKRDDVLFHHALDHARFVDDLDTLIDVVRTRNLDCEQPLSDTEVVKTASSAWGYQLRGENLKGRGGAMVIPNAMFDLLFEHPDVWRLITLLRRHHWSRDFYLANELAKRLSWGRPRFYAARDTAVRLGLIELARSATQQKPALYRWAQAPGCSGWYTNKKLDTSLLLEGSNSTLARFE